MSSKYIPVKAQNKELMIQEMRKIHKINEAQKRQKLIDEATKKTDLRRG